MSIFQHIPAGYTLRPVQRQILTEVEADWDEYDVHNIEAPPASGKSLIAKTIANWRNSANETVATLTPRATLQDQMQRDFPEVPSLKGKSKYKCQSGQYDTCQEYFEVTEGYCCGECQYKEAIAAIKDAPQAVFNFHSHLFGGMVRADYKDVLIIDEAHNLVPMLSDMYTLYIWKHKTKHLFETHTKDDIIVWLELEIADLKAESRRLWGLYPTLDGVTATAKTHILDTRRTLSKYKMILSGLLKPLELFHISILKQPYGRSRQVHECIQVKPLSMETVPHKMWPDGKVKKIILMSATMYDTDIKRLGITRKRVKHVKCGSPIPAEQRPVRCLLVARMSFQNRAYSTPLLCNKIRELAAERPGKGVVHLTYGLAPLFRRHLKSRRFLWHTEATREATYNKFLASKNNKILMACGMNEGIDLVGADYTWQVIAKIVFPSLSDPVNKHLISVSPLVYVLETIRSVVQTSGRICRTPSDYGETIIIDKSFLDFYNRSTQLPGGGCVQHGELFPQYFKEALRWTELKPAAMVSSSSKRGKLLND